MKHCLLLVILLISCNRVAHSNEFDGLTRYLQSLKEQNRFDGYVLIAQFSGEGESIDVEYLYSRSFQNNATEAYGYTDSTQFLIGSVTKPFVGFLVLDLIEQGMLDSSQTIDQWFPEFPRGDEITIQHLLDHKAGLADYKEIPDFDRYEAGAPSPQETVKLMAKHVALVSSPGERFRYSNVGYIMLGLVIENVVNEPINKAIDRMCSGSLRLQNTGVSAVDGLALPFTSGNMYSTPGELVQFIATNVEQRRLPSDVEAQQWINQRSPYKNGWAMRLFGEAIGVGHFGAMHEYVCSVTYLPIQKRVVVFCSKNARTPYRTATADIIQGLVSKTYPEVLSERAVTLSAEVAKQIEGTYTLPGGSHLTVQVENGVYTLQESNRDSLQMFPIEGGRFCFNLLERYVSFAKLSAGTFQELRLEDRSGNPVVTATRVPD